MNGSTAPMRDIAVGVMAYNEEPNIAALLHSIFTQSASGRVARVVVVASGCSDRTGAIVRAMQSRDDRIVLIEEPVRTGKIAAINTFLRISPEPILIVSCADLLFEPQTIEALVRPFEDPSIGMCAAHPVPLNDPATFAGFAVELMWELHHRVSLHAPKMGELVAFRNIVSALDVRALEDELLIEHHIRDAGFGVAYAPDAIVRNRGPRTLGEFVRQRIRCIVANLQVYNDFAARAPTMSVRHLIPATSRYLRERRPPLDLVLGVAVIEAWCRLRGWWDYRILRRHEPYRVWEPIASTKTLHT
jgi:biofilm PGA synthesis N-glycosyltransferase PgaC